MRLFQARTSILTLIGLVVATGIAAAAPWHVESQISVPQRPATAIASSGISAIWANDGGDKVAKEELRATNNHQLVHNSIWDGTRIRLFGAKNEVIAFNLILEASFHSAPSVKVHLSDLHGPNGSMIRSTGSITKDGIYNWTQRESELFFIRYLQIKGLSRLAYDTYDERHIPEKFRDKNPLGYFNGAWSDRPHHDMHYPDIAVPLELVREFRIAAGTNQSIWADIYIPRQVHAGLFEGELTIIEENIKRHVIPIELEVRNFTLPEIPASKTMVYTSYPDIARRYTGVRSPASGSSEADLLRKITDRQMLVARRHKISLIDDNDGAGEWVEDKPRDEWIPRLSGALFTRENGYSGPGEGIGTDVYSIATYGVWRNWWGKPSQQSIWEHTSNWESWFDKNFPDVERFLYLIDESTDYEKIETWASWMKKNPGPGRKLMSFATVSLPKALQFTPSLDVIASWMTVGDTNLWQTATDGIHSDPNKRIFLYNGKRPASGSFAIEDEGTALRELPWGQYKKGINRWFYWSATYYNDFQGRRGETNVFQEAQTFGGRTTYHYSLGMTSKNSTNGDGVLFYPGTDKVFPSESYDLEGPIASLRLKYWRRGIQDIDYLQLASKIDPHATQAIVNRMVPKVLWEVGISSPSDPTWVRAPISWSTNPDDWEAARRALARIIDSQ